MKSELNNAEILILVLTVIIGCFGWSWIFKAFFEALR